MRHHKKIGLLLVLAACSCRLFSQIIEKAHEKYSFSFGTRIQPLILWNPKPALSSTLEFPNIEVKNSKYFSVGLDLGISKSWGKSAFGIKLQPTLSLWNLGFWWTGVPNYDGTGNFPLIWPYSLPPSTKYFEIKRNEPPHSYKMQSFQVNSGITYSRSFRKFTVQLCGGISPQINKYLNADLEKFAQYGEFAQMPNAQNDSVMIGITENFQPPKGRNFNWLAFGELDFSYCLDSTQSFFINVGISYQQNLNPGRDLGEKTFHFSRYPYWNDDIGTTTWKFNPERLAFQFGFTVKLPLRRKGIQNPEKGD